MLKLLTLQTIAIAIGAATDMIVGDPHSLPHPVVAIGKLISYLEKEFRHGENDERDIGTGTITTIITVLLSTLIPVAILLTAYRINPYVYLAIDSIFCWQLLAGRQLAREAGIVEKELEAGNTEGARKAVSMIVGRDTEELDDKGITKAAVETVAENASDGVTAPLFWMFLFGAAGGFFCKAVNTLDSMIGYKNDKYIYFGRTAARLDDFVNFIPSRLSAILMIAASKPLGFNTKNAVKIFKRDRMKHASPNSAQTESVCAGALEVQLAGNASYGGVVKEKEFIGDPIREIEPKDISRANRLMFLSSAFMLALTLILRTAVILCF